MSLSKKKANYGRYIKGIIVLVVIIAYFYWYYYSYYLNPANPTTSSTTIASSTIVTTPPISGLPLTDGDFNLTHSSGCVFVNQTSGHIDVFYDLYVTNSFNESLNYVNASIQGIFLEAAGPTNRLTPVQFFRPNVLTTPTYGKVLTLVMAFPIGGKGFDLSVSEVTFSVHIFIMELGRPVTLLSDIPLSPPKAYPAC